MRIIWNLIFDSRKYPKHLYNFIGSEGDTNTRSGVNEVIKEKGYFKACVYFLHRIWFPYVSRTTYNKDIMEVWYSDGTCEQFKGKCTVWHKLPMMERCGTMKEGTLNSMWKYIGLYGNPYPTAHLNKKK